MPWPVIALTVKPLVITIALHIIMFPQYVAFLVKLMARTKADLRSARNAMAAERNNRSRSRDGPRDGGAGGARGGAASASSLNSGG